MSLLCECLLTVVEFWFQNCPLALQESGSSRDKASHLTKVVSVKC